MIRLRLRHQLFLLCLTSAVIVGFSVWLLYVWSLSNERDDDWNRLAQTVALNLAARLTAPMEVNDEASVRRLAEGTLSLPEVVAVSITERGGRPVYTADAQGRLKPSVRSWYPPLAKWLMSEQALRVSAEILRSQAEGQDASANAVLGHVTLEFLRPPQPISVFAILAAMGGFLFTLATGAMLSVWIERRFARPLRTLMSSLHTLRKSSSHNDAVAEDLDAWKDIANKIDAFTHQMQMDSAEHDSTRATATRLAREVAQLRDQNQTLETRAIASEQATQAKSDFFANMSYELRTPLNTIVGFTELLRQYEVDTAHADYVATIRQAANDLLILINEILDFTKIEAGELKIENREFDLYALVEAVINLLSRTAFEKGLDLFVYIDPEVPLRITSDPLRLKQAVINLLSNAVKYTAQGHVSLEIRHFRDSAGDKLQFEFHDTGPGIDEQQALKVFKPFTQAGSTPPATPPSTGLGLYITREIISKLEGDIGFDTKTGKGTTFWFTLPYSNADEQPYHKRNPLDRVAVLIYDTESRRLNYTKGLLEVWGLEVKGVDDIDTFTQELEDPSYRFIFFYLHRNDIDTDLQLSMERLAQTPAVKVLMHRGDYTEAPSPVAGILHLSNTIPPHHLHHYLYEAQHTADTTNIRAMHDMAQVPEDLSGMKILVADDDSVNQRLLEVYITRNNGEYLAAFDGQQAKDRVDSEIDAVIMDIHMPHVDGLTAMRSVKRRFPRLPVIALTAEGERGVVGRYRRLGFDECLTKPISEKRLMTTLLEMLNRKTGAREHKDRSQVEDIAYAAAAGLPPVDVDKAVQIAGGNRALAHELFNMLLADLKSKRGRLLASDSTDHDQLREIAHKIAGGAKFCAATRVQARAIRFETALDNSLSPLHISRLAKDLVDAINELVNGPSPYVDQSNASNQKSLQ